MFPHSAFFLRGSTPDTCSCQSTETFGISVFVCGHRTLRSWFRTGSPEIYKNLDFSGRRLQEPFPSSVFAQFDSRCLLMPGYGDVWKIHCVFKVKMDFAEPLFSPENLDILSTCLLYLVFMRQSGAVGRIPTLSYVKVDSGYFNALLEPAVTCSMPVCRLRSTRIWILLEMSHGVFLIRQWIHVHETVWTLRLGSHTFVVKVDSGSCVACCLHVMLAMEIVHFSTCPFSGSVRCVCRLRSTRKLDSSGDDFRL